MNKPSVVITHHAVSLKSHTVEDVDDWHKNRWAGFTSKYFKNEHDEYYHVGYHYVIDWYGKVTQTRGHHEEGAHTIGMNNSSIGVCFMGNFDNHLPSPAQEKEWKILYKKLQGNYPNIPTKPHRAYARKSCHGKMLTDNHFATKDNTLALKQELLRLMIILLSLIRKKHG